MLQTADLLSHARSLCQDGSLHGAAQLCAQALEQDPRSAESLHLLGVIAGRSGFTDSAAQLIGRAVSLNPQVASLHNDLGVARRTLGELAAAEVSYREALRLDPRCAEAHSNLGNLLRDQGRYAEAAECYRHALELGRRAAPACYSLGVCLARLGQVDAAIAAFRETLAINPDHAAAHRDLGGLLLDLERLAQAEAHLRRAVQLGPDSAAAHTNLGRALRKSGRSADSEPCFRRVLELQPHSIEALEDLGVALTDQGKESEALTCFRAALQLAPERAETYCNTGHVLLLQSQFLEARELLQRAVQLRADFPEAWNNLGACFLGQGLLHTDEQSLDEAEQCYLRALAAKPDYVDVRNNLALLHLLRGRFAEGWREWEWRWHGKEAALRRFQRPMWDGESLNGRTILLHTEGGFGDTFHFVRYARLLQSQGARVVLQCPKALRPVLSGALGIDVVVREREPTPCFDVHAPLMSLPGILGTTAENIPAQVPYILANPDRTAYWSQRLSQHREFKIGIAWQGNTAYKGDRRRSIPLACFEPLAQLPGVRLFSLQIGHGREQLAQHANRWHITDLGLPWAETAAVMMSLDLIVTSDTAMAHLAGALGRPTWLAVSYTPDWRWQMRRLDSPWYPQMRLFRQQGPAAWRAVFADMAASLAARLQRSNAARCCYTGQHA